MRQSAPEPTALASLVESLAYKAGWTFALGDIDRGQGCDGLTLIVTITTADSYHPERKRSVVHYFPVPPAAYDERSWQRWLFDQIMLVERHECCEFFRLVLKGEFVRRDGSTSIEHVTRPYAPSHGPGNDPYMVREIGTEDDVRTSFRGELNPAGS